MKKTLTIILVLTMVMGGMIFATDLGTATLTLGYKRSATADNTVNWYGSTDSATGMDAGSFNSGKVTAYLKATNSYSVTPVSLSVKLPSLTNTTDATTIGYTANLSLPSGVTNNVITSLESGTATIGSGTTGTSGVTFASIDASATLQQIGWVQFEFTADATDLTNATANTSYTADVVVTMAST